MKQLKFKIWNSAKKEWFTPVYEAYKGKLHDISITMAGQIMERTLKEPADTRNNHGFIPVLFTGLKDKEGTEIYEGDIVKQDNYEQPFEVIWHDNGRFCLKFNETYCNDYVPNKACKVIGNIYENAQLVKY